MRNTSVKQTINDYDDKPTDQRRHHTQNVTINNGNIDGS